MADAGIEDVLQFWFGDLDGPTDFPEDRKPLWWFGREEDDQRIADQFGALHRAARAGERDEWATTPRGRLALVLVLDQFSRCLGRGTADAFASDKEAQRHVIDGIEAGHDQAIRPIERAFFYMPLMHAEGRDMAKRSLEVFESLGVVCGEIEGHPNFTDHARQHAAIVEQFGRYPHRNTLLGRESTPEEAAYLAGDAPSFGQKKS